jgi:hypothetical protein
MSLPIGEGRYRARWRIVSVDFSAGAEMALARFAHRIAQPTCGHTSPMGWPIDCGMQREELERIKDIIDEIRRTREGTSADLYRNYSGAISNLRAVLRMHGVDYEPD